MVLKPLELFQNPKAVPVLVAPVLLVAPTVLAAILVELQRLPLSIDTLTNMYSLLEKYGYALYSIGLPCHVLYFFIQETIFECVLVVYKE